MSVFTILTILVLIASVLITLIVLLQNGKGGGLASNFVAGNQTFGVRQTADILEKITWGLVAFIFVLSVATTVVSKYDKDNANVDYSQGIEETEILLDELAAQPDVEMTEGEVEATPQN